MTENNCSESYDDYLARAASACEAGDQVLGMHLYLAAYEKAVADPDIADGTELAGLREAWNLACDLKERSMAEYVFEKLEPYLTGDEIAECASALQGLALDRLAEYGFSREDLEGMAEMISQDLMDSDASIVKVESISIPHFSQVEASGPEGSFESDGMTGEAESPEPGEGSGDSSSYAPDGADSRAGESGGTGLGMTPVVFNPYEMYDTSSVGKSYHAATNEGTDAYVFTRDKDRATELERTRSEGRDADARDGESASESDGAEGSRRDGLAERQGGADAGSPAGGGAQGESEQPGTSEPAAERPVAPGKPAVPVAASAKAVRAAHSELPTMPDVADAGKRVFNYHALVGYDETVSLMREYGIGLQRDPMFRNFVSMMNTRHGLDRMPALDTLLFRSPAVEDAMRFVDATVGELGLPMLRMSIEENAQGMPVLCVATQGDKRPRMNHSRNRFDGPGILVIDDLDMWSMPQVPEGMDGIAGFMMANMSRGAREAVNLIHSAVEDPDVYVLVTASTQGEPDPFFYELLEPITIIDIPYPNEQERRDIWAELQHDHPSMRLLNRVDLLRYSASLPRYDIYMAARAAIEDAYKTGLVQRAFVPVTLENILDKLAACQPLESDEYRAIEEAVVSSFRAGLDDLEGLVDELSE